MEKTLQKWIKKLEINENLVSTALGAVVLFVVGLLFYNYFTSGTKTLELPTDESENTPRSSAGEISATSTSRYTVTAGDNLWKIAQIHYGDGFRWVDIAKANNLANPGLIEKGQELDLPGLPQFEQMATVAVSNTTSKKETLDTSTEPQSNKTYTVQKGDFLWEIARQTYNDGYRWVEIWQANQALVSNPNILFTGQVLTLP